MTGRAGGLAAPAALECADPAEVLSGSLHAWAADFLRGLRMHEENAGSAQTAAAAGEAVRQLRRASRRIGSALLTYRSLVDAAWADGLSGELRRLSGTLAREYRCAARQDRLLAALHRLAVEGRGGDRAAALLQRQHTLARGRAHSAALETLVSSRFHAVADAVAVLAYEVPLTPGAAEGSAGAVLVPLAESARERLVRAVEALPPPARASARPGDGQEGRDVPPARGSHDVPHAQGGRDLQRRQDAAWFEVRILLRHHRYAQEVLYAPGLPSGGDRDGGAEQGTASAATTATGGGGPDALLRAASAALDRYRDSVESAEAAAAAARTPRIAPATAYVLGVLHAGQRQEAEAARREFGALWQRVAEGERPPPRRRETARQTA